MLCGALEIKILFVSVVKAILCVAEGRVIHELCVETVIAGISVEMEISDVWIWATVTRVPAERETLSISCTSWVMGNVHDVSGKNQIFLGRPAELWSCQQLEKGFV